MKRMKGEKPNIQRRHNALLEKRYDLSNRPARGATMFRGKALQEGPRAKLTSGVTWGALGSMSPDQIRQRNVFPEGFKPLPHPNHPEGGMVFPKVPHRRDQAAGMARLDPLRPCFLRH